MQRICLNESFKCDFTAEYNKLELSGSLSVTQDAIISCEITDPPSLAGLRVEYDGDSATIEYMGLTKSFSNESMSNSSFVSALYAMLTNSFSPENLTVTKQDDFYIADAIINGTDYSLTVNSDCLPTSISSKAYGFKMELFNFK